MRSLVVEAPAVSGDGGEEETAGSFVVVASHGGGLAATEVQVGLDLRLRGVDTGRVWGKSEHLLGQLVSPETAPATRHTVQVDFHEQLPADVQSFGLVKLRARVPWRDDGRHLLSFHRQMPKGWPEAPHVEADESALSGRTAAVTGPAHLYFGLPFLTADRTKVLKADVTALEIVLAWMRETVRGG